MHPLIVSGDDSRFGSGQSWRVAPEKFWPKPHNIFNIGLNTTSKIQLSLRKVEAYPTWNPAASQVWEACLDLPPDGFPN